MLIARKKGIGSYLRYLPVLFLNNREDLISFDFFCYYMIKTLNFTYCELMEIDFDSLYALYTFEKQHQKENDPDSNSPLK